MAVSILTESYLMFFLPCSRLLMIFAHVMEQCGI